jgi:hypothetical protein
LSLQGRHDRIFFLFVSFTVVVQLGLSIDEGALLEESMLDDAAVQVRWRCIWFNESLSRIFRDAPCDSFPKAVFATFISGDGEGKDGLEELQTRLRRISTCAQFAAK